MEAVVAIDDEDLCDPVGGAYPPRADERKLAKPAALGGTSHKSPVSFVAGHHDAFAIVASEDGRVTFARDP